MHVHVWVARYMLWTSCELCTVMPGWVRMCFRTSPMVWKSPYSAMPALSGWFVSITLLSLVWHRVAPWVPRTVVLFLHCSCGQVVRMHQKPLSSGTICCHQNPPTCWCGQSSLCGFYLHWFLRWYGHVSQKKTPIGWRNVWNMRWRAPDQEDMERGCAKRLPSTQFEQGGCCGS